MDFKILEEKQPVKYEILICITEGQILRKCDDDSVSDRFEKSQEVKKWLFWRKNKS